MFRVDYFRTKTMDIAIDLSNGGVGDYKRKSSTNTVNTDSGVSSTSHDETMERTECLDRLVDQAEDLDTGGADDDIDGYRAYRPGARASIDESKQTSGEFTKLVETSMTLSAQRSCSLPDILDIDNIVGMGMQNNIAESNRTCDSSDLNLSMDGLDEVGNGSVRKYGRGSILPVEICGKEHAEEPCFICMKDNEIYCSNCVQVHNFHCKEQVKFIPEIPPELRTKFCKETIKELTSMKERFAKVKAENEAAVGDMVKTKQAFVRSVMKYKNLILETIDKIEKEAMQQLDEIFKAENKRIETNLEYMSREITNLESYLKILENNSSTKWEESIVFELQEATKQVRTDETMIRDYHKSTNCVELNFEPLQEFMDLLSDTDSLWKVTRKETECCRFPAPCTCDKPYQYKVAEHQKDVSVRLSGWSFDRERCCITGCEFMPNGKLLLCDNSNKKVKLLDRKFKCISAQSLPSLPWDLAIINSERAVVTIPDRKQLQFVETHNRKVSLKSSVLLDKNCWGVSCGEDTLYVTCWSRDSSEIVVLDLDGQPQRCITTVEGVPFHTPWFIDTFNDASLDPLYVSDWGTYLVHCITPKGVSLSKYRNSYLVGPLGVTHDPEKNVYICGRDSNTVHQLSPAGQLQQVLLTEKDGVHQPLNIAHRRTDDKLVLTSWMSDKITIFKLQ